MAVWLGDQCWQCPYGGAPDRHGAGAACATRLAQRLRCVTDDM